ncbi:O-antigen ligase family protein [Agaribacter marinus]|uniref:O-antigen polymerase n=1 Tax=Agaribacter marinus TaxID=1431249 RepID=A0AA37T7D1_9ALTE|nr:O-antigen ligase family protein [Agaribacter marinus]GLR72880.1 O-antigen polymerase [Agaribacter marinus]
MKLDINQIYKLFLLISMSFYIGLIDFVNRLFTGGVSYGDMEGASSGNIVNQLLGLSLLGFIFVFLRFSSVFSISAALKSGKIWWLLIAFFAASIVWSYEPTVSIRRIIAFSTLIVTCYSLAVIFSAKTLITFVAELIFWVTLVGFLYHFGTGGGLSFGFGDRAAAMRGIYFDKNGAARVYAYGIILFFALKRYATWSDITKIAILSFALLTSASASGVVMAFFGVGLLFVFNLFKARTKQQTLLQFVILILALFLGAYLVSVLYELLLAALGRDPELSNRAIIWELIFPLIEDEWLKGYGFGAFWASSAVQGFVERWGFIGNAHSGYLEVLLHGGIIGLVILILIFLNHLKHVLALYLERREDDLSSLFFVLLIIQLVVNAVGYVILNHNSFDMFLFTLLYFVAVKQYLTKSVGKNVWVSER